jgi:two-component system, OmpR family, alkaline phosphatase synthesis response regulator PhoP
MTDKENKKLKIWLIEDDVPTKEIYEAALGTAGYEVECMDTARLVYENFEEIKQGKKEKPDLVLLDLILPDANGIEILKKAKADSVLKNMSFFIFTNYTDPDLERESLKLEADKYIVKTNFIPSQILETIREWFANKK